MKTSRFDNLVEKLPSGKVLVAVDVQGVELPVLRGFGALIDAVDYVYSEVNFEEVYQGCTLFDDLKDFLEEKGFVLACVERTSSG